MIDFVISNGGNNVLIWEAMACKTTLVVLAPFV